MLNIEAALVAWLIDNVTEDAYSDIPENRPKEFITVERVGGGKDTVLIDYPSVAIQCWAQSRVRAAEFAGEVDEVLQQFVYDTPHVAKLVRNGLYNHPDEESKTPRYQIVVDITTT